MQVDTGWRRLEASDVVIFDLHIDYAEAGNTAGGVL